MSIAQAGRIAVVRAIGTVLLVTGVASVLVGPAEIHTFFLFEEGGRFHYEGFGIGSLMFANIAIQVAGFYVLAALCIPVGYAHLKLRWWARPVMTTLLVDWLLVGPPLSLAAFLMLVTSKGVSAETLPLLAVGLILIYPVLPVLLLWFYRRPATRRAFQTARVRSGWLEDAPLSLKVVGSLMLLTVLALHCPLLFDGLVPLFGRIVVGRPGVLLIDFLIAATLTLVWGLLRRRTWSWWCAVILLSLITASTAVTFLSVPPPEVAAQMRLAPLEAEALSGIPLRGYHLALFFGFVPAVTLAAVWAARRGFTGAPGYSGMA